MDDTDNLPIEAEPEAIDTTEDEDLTEIDTEAEDSPEDGEPEAADDDGADDDLMDVEIDGKTFRVPKDAAFRQSDYTQKTQALAEQRKEVEAAIERLNGASEAETKALANVAYIEAQIAQYNDIDWQQWDQMDPVAANKARWELTELNRVKDGAIGNYQQARTQAQLMAKQETAKRLEQGQRVLAERIPGWGQDKAAAILDFGQKAYGFSREQLQSIDDPLAILVLHDAMEFRKVANKAATAKKIEKQQAIKPAPTVKGGAKVIKGLSDELSTDEWMRRRNAQVAKRR